MPRSPIINREIFYDTNKDGSIRFLDFALVNTELGAMVEMLSKVTGLGDSIAAVDLIDAGATRVSPMDEDQFYSRMGTYGHQFPPDYSS
jgi:hypothetical protein